MYERYAFVYRMSRSLHGELIHMLAVVSTIENLIKFEIDEHGKSLCLTLWLFSCELYKLK